ncbi:MAG: response regulator [bacterium]
MLSRPSLLTIEDDAYAQRLIGAVAKRAGFTATVAATGAEADVETDRIPFDIIIVDLRLPDAEGFELIERLQKKPQLENVPFLVCSGNVTIENVNEARRLGALEFIRKPLDLVALQQRLEKNRDLLVDRWIQPAPFRRRAAAEALADAEVVRRAREYLAIVLDGGQPVGPADVVDERAEPTPSSESEIAVIVSPPLSADDALQLLVALAPDIPAPRVNRLVAEFNSEPANTPRKALLHTALRVALTSLDQMLAS